MEDGVVFGILFKGPFWCILFVRSVQMADTGICPSCGKTKGEIFDICTNPVCADKGYHLIPEDAMPGRDEAPDIMTGQLIADKYLLTKSLGHGGMGKVFVALQRPLMREVAVKFLNEVMGSGVSNTMKLRFEREARALSVLDHPHIVKVFDYGIARIGLYKKDYPFMVLEYINNALTLRQLLNQRRRQGERLGRDEILRIFDQVLNGLKAAHTKGLVHRDIKPENIMVKAVEGESMFVKVLDFGLTKSNKEEDDFAQNLTVAGGVMGTPQYMAPEQLLGKPVDQRVDLYALGAILYECLSGKKPLSGVGTQQVISRKIRGDYDVIHEAEVRELSGVLQDFLSRAMAYDPAQRFNNVDEFKQALHRAFGDEGGGGAVDAAPVVREVQSFGQDEAVQETVLLDDVDATLEMSTNKNIVGATQKSSRAWFWTGLVVVLAVAGGLFVYYSGGGKATAGVKAVRPAPVPQMEARQEAGPVATSVVKKMVVVPDVPKAVEKKKVVTRHALPRKKVVRTRKAVKRVRRIRKIKKIRKIKPRPASPWAP